MTRAILTAQETGIVVGLMDTSSLCPGGVRSHKPLLCDRPCRGTMAGVVLSAVALG